MRVFASASLAVFVVGLHHVGFVAPNEAPHCASSSCVPSNSHVVDSEDGKMRPLQCHTYMAPSTLGDETNMGIFTGVDLEADEVVNWPEIVVPLLFREWAEHPEGYTDGGLWERYIWEGSVVDVETYQDTDTEHSKAGFIPGVGCTVNALMEMHNIESTHGSTYDTAGLHRSRDPGSGAFAPYHLSVTNAIEDIPAGSELFAGYGTEWIPDIPGAQMTLDLHLDEADEFLVDEYIPFITEHNDELTEELMQVLWDFTKDFPIYSEAFTNLPRYPWSAVEEFISQNLSELDDISIARHFVRKQHTRTLEWLQTHPNSYCQDHLKPGQSTIPQAGRGAFASRDLPAGIVVGYAPLIHVGKDGREIFHIEYTEVFKPGKRHVYDLIINYSFGHPESTMILTPYGGMVNYINHGSGDKANVKVRFPDKELIAHKPDWLDKDPEFFHHTVDKIGISFEYVALRDIKEGEEIFMDYGPVWETAWEEHVQQWEPLEGSENYVHSSEWDVPYLRTYNELENNPYPSNLHTMCISSYTEVDGEFVYIEHSETSQRWYCDVMARRGDPDSGYIYDIDLRIDRPEDDRDKEFWVFVRDVDPTAIFLTDKTFTTDWHMPNVFRHYIQIPDDVMPAAWLNGPDTFQLPDDDELYEEEQD